MNISWHGLSAFQLVSKSPNGEATIVIDPYDNKTGLRFPRTIEAHLALVSHNEADANNTESLQGDPFIVSDPGEYEVKGIFVFAISAPTEGEDKKAGIQNLIFRIEAEGMQIAHLGALDRELTDEELQELQNIDILMVPVGGGRVMTPNTAAAVIGQIEPRVVIPMTHALPNVKEKLSGINDFCKAMGACRQEETTKFKISRKDLPEEDMVIMKLSR